MKKAILTGLKFGRLTVKEFSHVDSWRKAHWVCICRCGRRITVRGQSLKQGGTRSCGCLASETSAENGRKAQMRAEEV